MSDFNEMSERLLKELKDIRARSARTTQTLRSIVEIAQQAKLEAMLLESTIEDLIHDHFESGVTPRLGTEGVQTSVRSSNIRGLLGAAFAPPFLDSRGSILRFQNLSQEEPNEPPPAA